MQIEVDLFGSNPNNINDISWNVNYPTDVAAMNKIGVTNIGVEYYLANMIFYTHTNNTNWGNIVLINASGAYNYFTMISWTDSVPREYTAHYRGVIRLKPTARLDGSFSIPISEYKPIGAYVDYNAGDWTEEDLQLIRDSEGSPTVNNSTDLPTKQGEFGGFTVGQSRNENATSWTHPNTGKVYTPKSDGWRVWDVSEDGQITLIHAGHSETYCHATTTNNSSVSLDILRNRNCSMYENEYAEKGRAKIITGEDAVKWYNKLYGTNFNMVNGGTNVTSTFCGKTFTKLEPISVLETGAWYWLASSWNADCLNIIWSDNRYAWYRAAKDSLGIRVLVTLKSGVEIDKTSGDGTENNPYKLVQK